MMGKHGAVGPKMGLISPYQCENEPNENQTRNREAHNDEIQSAFKRPVGVARKRGFCTASLNIFGMRNAIITAVLSLPMLVAAQRSVPAESICLGLPAHANARSCLVAEAAKSDGRLEQAERNLRQALDHCQEDESFKRSGIAAQKRASAEFLRARSAQCELQATLAAGGNGANDRRLLCRIELNERRVTDIQAIASSIK